MTFIYIRIFFLLISVLIGYQLGDLLAIYGKLSGLLGALMGMAGAGFIILLERGMRRISSRGLSAAVFGLIFGLLMARIVIGAIELIPMGIMFTQSLKIILTVTFCYLGMVVAMRGKDEFNVIIPYVKFARQDEKASIIILDTSVIIDGRIADICQTKFIEGRLVIPKFVLKELQQIADSQDPLKRNRGRRGLDMLNRIQKIAGVDVKIHEEDFPELMEVDTKLVKLAKVLGANIMTNDYNLNKVAELQGVKVLNINELANALKTVVFPGEEMQIKLIREGKEHNQAVGYLDDGTMVVVEEARRFIGQEVRVVVTSVLQTQAGRMIFTKMER